MASSDETKFVGPVGDRLKELPHEDRVENAGTALCLSGGGYRAMLYHIGGLIRLNEIGALGTIDRVSSVSGGSIVAARLGLCWKDLTWDDAGVATNFDNLLVDPIVEFASRTIDLRAVLSGLLRPDKTVGERLSELYSDHLFGDATLQDLPADRTTPALYQPGEGPRFVINATNVQTGKLFRFSRPYQGDWKIGLWNQPTTRIADAVTCSSAFPPVLSPHVIKASGTFDPSTTSAKHVAVPDELWLTDGGVYDNLGLETAWRTYNRILISDGGGALTTDKSPKRNWASQTLRTTTILDSQVRSLRKRQAINAFRRPAEKIGAYWGIRSEIENFRLSSSMKVDRPLRIRAMNEKTRLKKLSTPVQNDIINWGYMIADTSLRKWVYTSAPAPSKLPRN